MLIMANWKHCIGFVLGLGMLASCTEKITLEVPTGKKVQVIEGSITD